MGEHEIRLLLDDARRICLHSPPSAVAAGEGPPHVVETLRRLTEATEQLLAVCEGYDSRLRRTAMQALPARHHLPPLAPSASGAWGAR